jgi:hypothetical protein
MATAAPLEALSLVQAKHFNRYSDDDELDSLREENRQLKELVVHLSKLVARNVLERK